MKVMFFGLILLITAFSSASQEIQSNGFSLTLGNGWSVVNTNKITTAAANEESNEVQVDVADSDDEDGTENNEVVAEPEPEPAPVKKKRVVKKKGGD